ncbi:hypothetical protein Tsubulata_002757 [Turnera subulata]|uniref:Eukaryotic translation initiation factor 4G n=1 Tax=Turnera subulata TaxID=218843 RepID=A0A9Q0GFI0_9ROSI|nr:hypothetical protein Tsubulata_002757 [Turnera subulata]
MSFNQSRSDRNSSETTQYRKSGRSASSNPQRSSSGAYGKGGGGGPAPSPSSSNFSSNRSFSKKSNNAQGGQPRVNVPPANASDSGNAPIPRNVQNGAHSQPNLHGPSDAPPVASNASKQMEGPASQRSTRAVPKVPPSQSASVNSEPAAPSTPVKGPGDASKAFAFQFGSISPGFMNGMQVPARTSSAPPNLDEQKRDQARHAPFTTAPPVPIAPKQPLPGKDASAVDHSSPGDAHPIPSKGKKETQPSPAPPVNQMQKPSVLPIPMTSVQMPFHQPPVSVQFGGPNPQVQSQNVAATSLQMPIPMPLPMGNAPQVQQPLFVQGLQPHPMPPQGIMHQGQSLSFTTQMGPQMGPQLGNLGMGITSQYPHQQGGKFGGQRKTPVKITDPKTHEELRLDKRTDTYADGGSSGLRTHPNVPQSQPIHSFAPSHPMNYYPYFQGPSSLPLSGNQIAANPQQPRFNYPVSQSQQNVPLMNTSALNSLPLNKPGSGIHSVAEPVNSERTHAISSAQSGAVQVTVRPPAGSLGEKTVEPFLSSSFVPEKGGSHKSSAASVDSSSTYSQRESEPSSGSSLQQPKPANESLAAKSLPVAAKHSAAVTADIAPSNPSASVSSVQSEEPTPVVANSESRRKETLSRSNSIKDHQKKQTKKGYTQPQHQATGQSPAVSSMPAPMLDPGNGVVSETVEPKVALSSTTDSSSQSARESVSATGTSNSDASESKVDLGDGITGISSKYSGTRVVTDSMDAAHHAKVDGTSAIEQHKHEAPRSEERGEKVVPGGSKLDESPEIPSPPVALSSAELAKQTKDECPLTGKTSGNDVSSVEAVKKGLEEPVNGDMENDRMLDSMDASMSSFNPSNAEKAHGNYTSMDLYPNKCDNVDSKEVSVTTSGASDQQPVSTSVPDASETTSKHTGDGDEEAGGSSISLAAVSKDKPVDLARSKSTTTRVKKKKIKEILQKADAAGTTSDLYMAYKGPEEKKEVISSEVSDSASSSSDRKQADADAKQVDRIASEEKTHAKAEPDDWEDAADVSTPKLETSDDMDGNANSAKKYSRDFLLKFSEQCTDLPEGFEITADIADALMSSNVSHLVDRDSYPSPGRVVDRSGTGARMDRRGSGLGDDDRWSKVSNPFGPGNMRLDVAHGGSPGFRPGPGGNYGVLRNPRAQTPVAYAGGILSGPMQPMGPQGGMQRSSPDADRWQRATNFQQKGLFPSPQTPLQVMHKAERKYEVGKVTDEEQAKQRQLKAILNKLTPQNFEKLFEQVKAVNIDNASTLNGVISQIFDKALMEPTFCEMYANFCFHLARELPDFGEDNEKVTFKRVLLNKCQEEFERGEREQEEANKADEEGEIKLTEEEREERRVKARRRMLGNIRLIGELYKKKMLTERIMHECIRKLLGEYQNPDEEDVEALCKLMSTIGEMIDHPKAKEHMDYYFDMMSKLSINMKLSSRVRFMLKDAIDLRKNKWQQRRKVEGPKKIEEVHRDAAQERQQQTSRLARNQTMNPSARRTMDFGPRGSNVLSSPISQMSSFRGLPSQVRGFGGQDARFDERASYETRNFSVPLPQRPPGDDITLVPQGGLARGMSSRGSPAVTSTPIADNPPIHGDSRRIIAGVNGFSGMQDRPAYSPREEHTRYVPDRHAVPAGYDQFSAQERNLNSVNRDQRNLDRGFDRALPTSPPARAQGSPSTRNVSSEKVWPEERLRDMSMAAIKEYYSARDEKEVALCIRDLNSPSFHPSMISLWVTDSFERKDMERDLLAMLLVDLIVSHSDILTRDQLIRGFESVLTTLEDAVNDAPKAAEFLGSIFAKTVTEEVLPLSQIGQLLHEGGEDPGRLREIGLAGDVLGSTLQNIKKDKGERRLNELIRSDFNYQLEEFKPPDPNRSRILENFI